MIGKLFPKDEKFIPLFVEMAGYLTLAADALVVSLESPIERENAVKKIENLEHQADQVTHKTINQLHDTFITPFDRHHIHTLICRMDEILDLVHAFGQRMSLYKIGPLPPDTLELGRKCREGIAKIAKIVPGLKSLKDHKEMRRLCVEIHRIENEADTIYRHAQARLYDEENDIKQMLKLKELNEILESVTDLCEDFADMIEGILLEYA